MTHEFCSIDLARKQVTSCSFYDPQQRIDDQIKRFWNPLGRHFVCSLRESIHEHLNVVLTRKNIYVEKLRDIYIELFEIDTAFGYISIDILDIYITIWIQILQFGYIYCNLDIYIVIWT